MNKLTDQQLQLLGIASHEIWDKNRELYGHKDGESFEDFFVRKHGYPSDKHNEEINARDLPPSEKIENRIKVLEDKTNQIDAKLSKVITSINAENTKLFNTLEARFKDIEEKMITLITSFNNIVKTVERNEKVLFEKFKLSATPKLLNTLK